MALALNLTYAQSNNAVTLTIVENVGEYSGSNTGGWDDNGINNPDWDNIVAGSNVTPGFYHLILDVAVTDKSNVTTTYNTINLYDHHGGAFADTSDFEFDFTPAKFISGTTAMGSSTDKLVDGIYDIKYRLVAANNHSTITTSVLEDILIDGDVRLDVYNQLRQVSVDYECEHNDKSKEHMDALLSYTYLQSIEAASSLSESESIISQLYSLDKMVSDGSKYTW